MRLITGNIWLEGAKRFAVAFDSTGIRAYDQEAIELGITSTDLGEAFLTHAFMDGHAHPLFAGREHLGPDVTHAKSIAQVQAIVKTWLSEHETPYWAVGGAYDRSMVEGGVFLATWLDEVSGNRPVVLHASDHHTLWANSAAIAAAGIELAPKVSVGSIDVDSNGRPTGVFRETEAKELITSVIPPLSIENELVALEWAQSHLVELGIAAVQDAWMDTGMVEAYVAAARDARLKLYTNLAFWARPESWRDDSQRFVTQRGQIERLGHQLLEAKTVKFFADGVFGSATAAVKKPYESSPEYLGDPVWTQSELDAAVTHFNELGFQIHIHAIGDAGVCSALDSIERAGAIGAVIAHTELVADEDIDRFAKLGVTANFEPLWARKDGMLTSCIHHLGVERIDSMYRMRDIADTGAQISFGSDWPVSSPDPVLGLFTAVHRAMQETPEASWTPEQALTATEALDAYSVAVARQLGISSRASHFVVLSQDPRGSNILETRILETIIGGQTAFARQ